MTETGFDPDIHPPRLSTMPEQLVPSGKAVNLNMGDFVERDELEDLHFSMTDGPDELSMDPKTGFIMGQAPVTELNKTYLVTFTVTNANTNLVSIDLFRLEIVGSLLLETDEVKEFFDRKELNFWDACKIWELQLFIQQLIAEHFAWVMMYDESKTSDQLGELIKKEEAQSGWLILEFENAVMITPGDKAFETYGSRRRILETLREASINVVSKKTWETIAIDGSDDESIGKGWVVAKELDLPVDSVAPTDIAEINYYNIKRVFADNTPSKPKLRPAG